MNAKLKTTLILSFLIWGFLTAAYASGTSSSSWNMSESQNKQVVSFYDQGVEATKNGNYQTAKMLFEQALNEDSSNPDIYNMLAHAQLKLGMIDESLETYKKALQLRPKFPEAREYLGEAYIQAALRELDTLRSYGQDGVEQAEDLEKEIKKATGH